MSSKNKMKSAKKVNTGIVIDDVVVDHYSPLRQQIETIVKVSTKTLLDKELSLAEQLAHYINMMSPGKMVDKEDGVKYQKQLFNVIMNFLKSDRERFDIKMGWFLSVIRENRKDNGAFSDRHIMRFYAYLNLPTNRIRGFQRLINVLITASGMSNRRLIGQRVDIDAVVDFFQDNEMQENLLIFFGAE